MRVEQIGDCTLILADNRDVLPSLAGFDLLMTDPPYGIGESSEKISSRQRQVTWKTKAAADQRDYGKFAWDAECADIETMALARSAARWAAIFGGNHYALPPTSCWLIWDKLNGSNDFADCELAWTNWPTAVRRIQWIWNGMIRKGREERFHPTQKPLGVIMWAIDLAPAAATVLDPWMGSGTTGVACAKSGRAFTGIERDERYFEVACRRISDAYASPNIFVERPSHAKQEALF